MANLKNLKLRIKSVKSTQKITKAMKMVSASKLRKAREAIEANRPYTEKMNEITKIVASNVDNSHSVPLFYGKEEINKLSLLSEDYYMTIGVHPCRASVSNFLIVRMLMNL